MWNLVYLQLLIEELGHTVANLGSCVPDPLLLAECCRRMPNVVVVSSVNGHGFNDGLRIGPMLRSRPELQSVALAIGGKLGVDGGQASGWRRQLERVGFDSVFGDTAEDVARFQAWLATLHPPGVQDDLAPELLPVTGAEINESGGVCAIR